MSYNTAYDKIIVLKGEDFILKLPNGSYIEIEETKHDFPNTFLNVDFYRKNVSFVIELAKSLLSQGENEVLEKLNDISPVPGRSTKRTCRTRCINGSVECLRYFHGQKG